MNFQQRAALAAVVAVVVLAVAVPLASHQARAHRSAGTDPIASPTASSSPTASPSATATATVAGPKARLFIEDFAGTGATFYLTGIRIQDADGATLGGYPLPAHPPAGAFAVSADGTRIAYLATDGIHVANAIDDAQDHVVHALPLDPSRPDPTTGEAQQPFANWARGSTISWSANGSNFAVAWQGCLWVVASDGSGLNELARNTTSTPVEGIGGVVGTTWSPSSSQLLVSVYGSATLLKGTTPQTFGSDPSTGSGIATAIVAANGTSYRPLPGQVGAWYWLADDDQVVGWNPAGTSLVTIAAAGGASHTVAAFSAGGTVSVAPDGMRVAGIGPDGVVNVWSLDDGAATTVRTSVVEDSVQQQLDWLDTHRLILATTGPDRTTHVTILNVTGSTRSLPDLHPSTASGYLVIDARAAG